MARYDRVISPGGTGKVTLTIDTSRVKGEVEDIPKEEGAYTANPTIRADDPKKPIIRLMVRGEIRGK